MNESIVVYDSMLLLTFDIENIINVSTPITRFKYHFTVDNVVGKIATPYAVVFYVADVQHKWSLRDIISHFHFVPAYRLSRPISSRARNLFVDTTDTVTAISETSIRKSQSLFQCRTDTSIFKGERSILDANDSTIISTITSILDHYHIAHALHRSPSSSLIDAIIVYTSDPSILDTPITSRPIIHSRTPDDDAPPLYTIAITFDNIIRDNVRCCVAAAHYDTIHTHPDGHPNAIGYFRSVSYGIPVAAPDIEHIAIIVRCPHCERNIIRDYRNIRTFACPICGNCS